MASLFRLVNNTASASRIINVNSVTIVPSRNAAGKWRADNNLPPRFYPGTVLTEAPEFSFTDGRGYGPMNHAQKMRYYRDGIFTNEVIQITNQMVQAKKLVPDGRERPQLRYREKFRGFDNMP